MEKRALMLRLDQDLAARLEALAEVEGRTMSDIAREAIAHHIDRRRSDPRFQRQIRESMDRHRRLLELLAKDDE